MNFAPGGVRIHDLRMLVSNGQKTVTWGMPPVMMLIGISVT